jgi:hypothetical protein
LPDPPARHFIPRDDPESTASTPRPMRRSNRQVPNGRFGLMAL